MLYIDLYIYTCKCQEIFEKNMKLHTDKSQGQIQGGA